MCVAIVTVSFPFTVLCINGKECKMVRIRTTTRPQPHFVEFQLHLTPDALSAQIMFASSSED